MRQFRHFDVFNGNFGNYEYDVKSSSKKILSFKLGSDASTVILQNLDMEKQL